MSEEIIPVAKIALSIYLIRGQKVLLDFDLAHLYDVTTGNLNKAIKRNPDRFPVDFMFRLNVAEWEDWIFRSGISKARGGRRHLPYAFTEQGVAMLSSVLRSERAAKVNTAIMRAFVKFRAALETNGELAKKFTELEQRVGKHDDEIAAIIEAIRQLIAPESKPRHEIGFHVRESSPRYGARKRR